MGGVEVGGWPTSLSGRSAFPAKNRCHLYKRFGVFQGRFWTPKKKLSVTGDRTPISTALFLMHWEVVEEKLGERSVNTYSPK